MTVALESWSAWGTSVHVLATDADRLGRATTAVRNVLADVDSSYSRFREDSELTRLNASAGRMVRVSPLLATAIDAAQRAARLTDGAVDPTVGQAIRVAGYDDDFARIVPRERGREIKLRATPVPGWQSMHFDRRSRTVLLPLGVELDLGSTGKARRPISGLPPRWRPPAKAACSSASGATSPPRAIRRSEAGESSWPRTAA
jgi:thiamine biosynthesis lipoprotein